MSVLRSLLGYTRVMMFIPVDYREEFNSRIIASGLCKDVEFHKVTKLEAMRFGIKRPESFLAVTMTASQRNKKKLVELRREFDRFVVEDRDRRSKVSSSKISSSKIKIKRAKPADVAKQKLADKLKNRRSKSHRVYRG